MSNDQVITLAIGAAIALISTSLTTILTSYLSYRIARRAAYDEAVERLSYLAGKSATTFSMGQGAPKLMENWNAQLELLTKFIKVASPADLQGMIGVVDAMLANAERLELQLSELQSSSVKQAEPSEPPKS